MLQLRWTGTISIAIIRALTVLRAGVPALALVHFFSYLAHLGLPVKYVSLAAAKLVGLLIMVAREIVSTVCWVGMNGMCLKEVLWPNNVTSGTAESINFINNISITKSGLLTGLLCSYTASNLDIEYKWLWARELKSPSIIALNILVTNILLVVIKHSIGFLTPRISVFRWLLDKLASATVNIMWQDAFLMVRDAVIKEKTLWTIFYGCNPLPTDVEQVTLFKISELAISFRTVKEWSFIPI